MSAEALMRLALRLARRGYGRTSPNPMVGAVLVRGGKILGKGWHHAAGQPHAEIEALRDAVRRGESAAEATLYVTLEPCSTHGRTPPCTDAIIAAGIREVIVGATDPNPKHKGKGFTILREAGLEVRSGVLERECIALNEAFNHWVCERTPFVTVKAAMTLDGKIATSTGESKWITGVRARQSAMKLRQGADAILVGVNTVLADDPSLTVRLPKTKKNLPYRLRRIVLDSLARTPLGSKVVRDAERELTTIVVSPEAPARRVERLRKYVRVLEVRPVAGRGARPNGVGIDIRALLKQLGEEGVTSLLVEGGGEVQASFLMGGYAQRIAFFYATKVIGGGRARRAVAGIGATNWEEVVRLTEPEWRKVGSDLLLTARVEVSRS